MGTLPYTHTHIYIYIYLFIYVFASIQSHYITPDKSQQYTYHANNTNKMHRSHTNIPQLKGHHITKTAHKITILLLVTVICPSSNYTQLL
jgi:hypothetical protein